MVPQSLPLLLSEGLAEALNELVQFLGVAAQELPDVLQVLQAVGGRRVGFGLARVHLHRSGDAQDAVALLLVVVEGFVEQDGDRHRSWEAGPQQDLPVLDPDLLKPTTGGRHTGGWRVSHIMILLVESGAADVRH